MKPRLVKSQREMEGRFEDVWVLVDEEDEVETWPDDAELGIVGSPTIRQDGPVRASGAARFTVDVQLPGMLHAAVLRAPVARCRVTALDLDAARATAGVRAAMVGNICRCGAYPKIERAILRASGQDVA